MMRALLARGMRGVSGEMSGMVVAWETRGGWCRDVSDHAVLSMCPNCTCVFIVLIMSERERLMCAGKNILLASYTIRTRVLIWLPDTAEPLR